MSQAHTRRRTRTTRGAASVALSVAAVGALLAQQGLGAGMASAHTPPAAGSTAHGRYQVDSAVYDLGNSAFHDDNINAPMELTAVVHYPRGLGSGRHPLIIQEHGLWITCADRQAQSVIDNAPPPPPSPPIDPEHPVKPPPPPEDPAVTKAWADVTSWPCRPGVEALPSNRGYDYLGEDLAGYGFIVVSIAANGINSADNTDATVGDAYQARAGLINTHLAMWQQLAAGGRGRPSGKFTDPVTGRPKPVDFRGHVDMNNVGTMGHSRGGEAVMRQAADKYRGLWPSGVKVKAVFALAPVYPGQDDYDKTETLVTRLPVAGFIGDCDAAGAESQGYIDDATGKNKFGLYNFAVQGANHNFFNTEWSPAGGQVGATDDAYHREDNPGMCVAQTDGTLRKQLTEAQQRQITTVYIADFYRRFLLGDHGVDAVLDGKSKPFAATTRIDVQAQPPRTGSTD